MLVNTVTDRYTFKEILHTRELFQQSLVTGELHSSSEFRYRYT